MFPDGYIESGDCTAEQKAAQLIGMSNLAILVRSGGGDSYQVVAEMYLPMAYGIFSESPMPPFLKRIRFIIHKT